MPHRTSQPDRVSVFVAAVAAARPGVVGAGTAAMAGLFALTLAAMVPDIWWVCNLATNFQPHMALAGAAGAGLALGLRRRGMASLAALVFALNAVPTAAGLTTAPAATGPADLRVMTANLRYDNAEIDRIVALLDTVRPDVLLLQEVDHVFARNDPALNRMFTYRVELGEIGTREGDHGTMIYSRHPIGQVDTTDHAGVVARFSAARIEVAGQDLWVASIHTLRPTNARDHARQRAQFRELTAWAAAVPGPLVLAGDFNATLQTPQMQDLLHTARLTHDLSWRHALRAITGTYPDLPPVGIKIDHVLGRGVSFGDTWLVQPAASDHRAVVADLVLNKVGISSQ